MVRRSDTGRALCFDRAGRLPCVTENEQFTSYRIAERYSDLLWDVRDEEREVMDCRVIRSAGAYRLRVTCDTPHGTTLHFLTSAKAVEQFLNPPDPLDRIGAPEVESWDADMGL